MLETPLSGGGREGEPQGRQGIATSRGSSLQEDDMLLLLQHSPERAALGARKALAAAGAAQTKEEGSVEAGRESEDSRVDELGAEQSGRLRRSTSKAVSASALYNMPVMQIGR